MYCSYILFCYCCYCEYCICSHILLYCCYFNYFNYFNYWCYCAYCMMLRGSRWSESSWPYLGHETCCNCETGWRSGRSVPSCHAQGMAGLLWAGLCYRPWSFWWWNWTGWFGRSRRWVMAVRSWPHSWAFWTGFHIKYQSKSEFCVSK